MREHAPMIITCVHQGYELYGSDRSFAATVAGIRDAFPSAEIDVVLPRHGPIVPLLEGAASRIIIEPLWVLRRRDLKRLATIGLLELPAAVFRAWSRLRRSDIVYVNTSVVADYMIAARFCTGRSVIHIHEIPDGLTLRLLRTLVRWSRADIIFNSCATRDAFALPAGSAARVIYNGVAGPPEPLPQSFDGSRPLRLLMLGRFSRIKGQEVLIEALGLLPQRLRPEVRIVGGAFEDQSRARSLADLIAARGLADTVSLMPFTPDPGPLYCWADVVAVPSRLPESLGRVAIEAMAFGRPPLASAIGGLGEVVEDGRTGWLVEPDSPPALARALETIIADPAAWADMPAAARRRYETLFSEPTAAAATQAALCDLLARDPPGRRSDLPARRADPAAATAPEQTG